MSSILLLDVYVRGQTQLSLGMSAPRNPAAAETGPHDDPYARRLRALVDPAVFPRITAALASGALEDDTDVGVDEFGFGAWTPCSTGSRPELPATGEPAASQHPEKIGRSGIGQVPGRVGR